MQRNPKGSGDTGFDLKLFKVLNPLPGALDLQMGGKNKEGDKKNCVVFLTYDTFTARVRIAAITSRDPPRIRLSGKSGSYSQIADVVSTAAIFVMCPITSIFPRLTTCPRHLEIFEQ